MLKLLVVICLLHFTFGATPPCDVKAQINGRPQCGSLSVLSTIQNQSDPNYDWNPNNPPGVNVVSSGGTGSDVTEQPFGATPANFSGQLIDVLNNIKLNIHLKDDGIPVYWDNGKLVIDPEYMKKKIRERKSQQFICPPDDPNRRCTFGYRTGYGPRTCNTDDDCQGSFMQLCCYDSCLRQNTCKPPLAVVNRPKASNAPQTPEAARGAQPTGPVNIMSGGPPNPKTGPSQPGVTLSSSGGEAPPQDLAPFGYLPENATGTLLDVINNIKLNLKLHDDDRPAYLHNGKLVINPAYLRKKAEKQKKIMQRFYCPPDDANRRCYGFPQYRFGVGPMTCTTDEHCRGSYMQLCCYDRCLGYKTCKPPLTRPKT